MRSVNTRTGGPPAGAAPGSVVRRLYRYVWSRRSRGVGRNVKVSSPLPAPPHERRHAGRWLVVHVGPLFVGHGPGEPLQPLAFQRQLRLVEVERKVLEQLERALVRGLELGFADELHLPGRLERPIEEPAAPIP